MNPERFILILFLSAWLMACSEAEVDPIPQVTPPSIRTQILYDNFEGKPIIIVGNPNSNFMVSFEQELEGQLLEFEPIQFKLPTIMIDHEGTEWDIFGHATSGPRKGAYLKPTNAYIGYWFAWSSFYPGIAIHGAGPDQVTFQAQPPSSGWLVSLEEVFDAGVGVDGIPALEEPDFLGFRERDFLEQDFYLKDDDLVIGISVNGETRAYPHAILNWHEIVNDRIDEQNFAVIFCPLTGTGNCWNREVNGTTTTFGVSGLLYNNNIIPYDRTTGSRWSQLRGDCIYGELINDKAQEIRVVETSWGTWKSMYEVPKVLSLNTGYGRSYEESPYGDYPTDQELIFFPLRYQDNRLPPKERVLGIIGNESSKVYRFESFK